MSDNIYHKKTRNWVKGILALNKTRTALCGCIDHKLEKFINEVLNQEKNHLEQFFLCLKKHDIQQLKQLKLKSPYQSRFKREKKKLSCEHELCSFLMKRFIKIHDENQTLRDSYQWSQSGSSTTERPITDKSKKERDEETKGRIWKITALYMVIDKGDDAQQYHCLDDLDISKVVKIMRSCTIFVPDGSVKLYDAIIRLRNDLMHSPHNYMEDENVKVLIDISKQLLDCLKISEASCYQIAMQELRKLEDNDIFIGYGSIEKDILEKVGAAKEIAAKLDKAIHDWNKECKTKSKQLYDLLEKICQTGMQPMVYQPREYKTIVEECMEKQVKALDCDIASCDKQDPSYSYLKRIRQSIEQKWKELLSENENDEQVAFLGSLKKTTEQPKRKSENTETERGTLETKLQEHNQQSKKERNEIVAASSKSAVREVNRRDESGVSGEERKKVKEIGNLKINSSNDSESFEENFDDMKLWRSDNREDFRRVEADVSKEEKMKVEKTGILQTISSTEFDSTEENLDAIKLPQSHNQEDCDGLYSTPNIQFPVMGDNRRYTEERNEPSSQKMYSEKKGASSYGRSMSLNRHNYSSAEEYDENGEFNKDQAHTKMYNASSREDNQESSRERQNRPYVMEDEYSEDGSSQKGDHKFACETFVYFSKSSDIYSQWHPSKFTIDDQEFNCAQQFMTYKKAVLFEDFENAGEILKCTDPGRIREIGKKIKRFDEKTWKENCIRIAKEGNRAKFSQNKKLSAELIATHPKILVEASPSNTTWGIGLKETSPRAWDESTWQGKNCLGYILTEVRDDIMAEHGKIGKRDRKIYTDKLLKDTANPSKRERGHKYDSGDYFYFESGIYSMNHRSDFRADGRTFRSVQQYLMYKKAELFKDFEKAEEILTSVDPKFLQQKGREVKGFKEDIWKSHRLQIAKDGNMAKFSQNGNLRRQIILTHPKKFVMASPNDKIWGIGLAEQDPKSRNKNTWNGNNDFGNVLTEVRNTLWSDTNQRKRRTNEGDTSD